MSGLLTFRDSVRDFLRKYDEIITPVFRFIASLILFWSISALYGYSELFGRGLVIFLLSVIGALVSNPVVVMLAGADILVNTISVSVEVGVVFAILFVAMYCVYLRLFPKASWILMLVPFLYLIKLQFMVPVLVVIFAGAIGLIPAAFGVVLYYFSTYVSEVKSIMETATGEEDFQSYSYIIDGLAHNKEMLLTIIVFAVVILVSYLVYRLSFDYSWYVAIGIGGVLTLLLFFAGSYVLDVEIGIGALLLGSILGSLLACLIQMCKSMVDYSRKETVQFEDDEYYYYVKAVPKYNVATEKVNVQKITGSKEMAQANQQRQPRQANTNAARQPGASPVKPANGNTTRQR